MRLWTLHPKYLDARGLAALWREGLLGQAVLNGETKGYRHHPQLIRFRACPDPVAAIASYLEVVCEEAERRGYRFDRSKIGERRQTVPIEATEGQLLYEWSHLRGKLAVRDPQRHEQVAGVDRPDAHPLFRIVSGDIAIWERTS